MRISLPSILIAALLSPAAYAITSVQAVTFGPTNVSNVFGMGDVVGTVPLRWQGPVPANLDPHHLTLTADLTLDSHFQFDLSGNVGFGPITISNQYTVEFGSGDGGTSGGMAPPNFESTIIEAQIDGHYDQTVVDQVTYSFPIDAFDLSVLQHETLFNLNIYATAPDVGESGVVFNLVDTVSAGGTVTITGNTLVPEPASLAFLGLGVLALAAARRR